MTDTFTAVFIMLGVVFSVGYGIGRYLNDGDMARQCSTRNEVTLNRTVYSCKPIAVIDNEIRYPLEPKP